MVADAIWNASLAKGKRWERISTALLAGFLAAPASGSSYDAKLEFSVEVKFDERSAQTGNFYVEYEQRSSLGSRPSGISVTEASYFCFVRPTLDDTRAATGVAFTYFSTDMLKNKLSEPTLKTARSHEPGHVTKGYLLPVSAAIPTHCITLPIAHAELLIEHFTK